MDKEQGGSALTHCKGTHWLALRWTPDVREITMSCGECWPECPWQLSHQCRAWVKGRINMLPKAAENLINRPVNEGENAQDGEVATDIRRSIAELYIDGRCNMHVHIGFGWEKYCAIFDRHSQILPPGDTVTSEPHSPEPRARGAPSEKQVLMLVRVAQDLQLPQMFPVVVNACTVARLKRINDVTRCVGHPAELTLLVSLITGAVLEDRELILNGRTAAIDQDELPQEMVKAGTEVIEHVSDDDLDSAWHGRHMLEAANLLSRLVVDLAGDSIGLEVLQGAQVLADCVEVFLGPVIRG